MAGFGQPQWGMNPSMNNEWAAQQQQQLEASQWSGQSQQQYPNMNAFGVQQRSNVLTGNQNYWADQNQMGVNQWNQQNQWNQTAHWSNQAPASNIGAWASHPENQWTHQNLAGPAGFGGTTNAAVPSAVTDVSTPPGPNLVLGNGTSGNLWEHANWPSSSYQLDAPQFAGMGR